MVVLAATVLVSASQIGMAVGIACFITAEVFYMSRAAVLSEVLAAMRVFSAVAVVAIEAVVDVTPESIVPVIPGTCTDEDAAGEPFRSVVAIWCAIERSVVEIAVGALGRRPNLHCDLRVRPLGKSREANCGRRQQQIEFNLFQNSS